MSTALWILALALIVVGVVGTVLPAVPGAILVFGGIVLAAWIDDFTHVPVWVLAIVAVLTVMAWAVDLMAAALGARRVGAGWLS